MVRVAARNVICCYQLLPFVLPRRRLLVALCGHTRLRKRFMSSVWFCQWPKDCQNSHSIPTHLPPKSVPWNFPPNSLLPQNLVVRLTLHMLQLKLFKIVYEWLNSRREMTNSSLEDCMRELRVSIEKSAVECSDSICPSIKGWSLNVPAIFRKQGRCCFIRRDGFDIQAPAQLEN